MHDIIKSSLKKGKKQVYALLGRNTAVLTQIVVALIKRHDRVSALSVCAR